MKQDWLPGVAVAGLVITGIAGIFEGGAGVIGSALAFGILLYILLD